MSEQRQPNKYDVIDRNGKYVTSLNGRMAIAQGVNDDQLEGLKASHLLRRELFQLASERTDNSFALEMLAKVFDCLEDEQQKLWNFKVDPNYHRFFDMPGCTCPKMDNAERLGTPYKIHSEDCPIHGHWAEIVDEQ